MYSSIQLLHSHYHITKSRTSSSATIDRKNYLKSEQEPDELKISRPDLSTGF